jgi:hypothetical protein
MTIGDDGIANICMGKPHVGNPCENCGMLVDPRSEKPPKLTAEQAGEIEAEMRHLESDPETSKRALRLFMQSAMPCGHAVGNLLTCPDPPFGCVVCGVMTERFERHLGRASQTVSHWPKWKQDILS